MYIFFDTQQLTKQNAEFDNKGHYGDARLSDIRRCTAFEEANKISFKIELNSQAKLYASFKNRLSIVISVVH